MNSLVLAFLGDAVYELYIREQLIKKGISKVKTLQKEKIKYVSATNQVRILEFLENKGILTEEEKEIVKRGRNSHSHSNPKTDIITYKKSTGFESLVGHLYLNDKKRLDNIMKEVFENESIW